MSQKQYKFSRIKKFLYIGKLKKHRLSETLKELNIRYVFMEVYSKRMSKTWF